ncbi:MAG TPA: hypothetical protein VFW87_02975 [Pirellulales bacterium]|nr:hypothetical protein [Pirellulales bacterium]
MTVGFFCGTRSIWTGDALPEPLDVPELQWALGLLRQELNSPEELQSRSLAELENLAVQLKKQLDARLANGT